MELIKRNIHMDCIKTQAVTQFTLEEDVNIPDSKPDVHSLNLERAELVTEEIRPGNGYGDGTGKSEISGFISYAGGGKQPGFTGGTASL